MTNQANNSTYSKIKNLFCSVFCCCSTNSNSDEEKPFVTPKSASIQYDGTTPIVTDNVSVKTTGFFHNIDRYDSPPPMLGDAKNTIVQKR